MSLGKSAELLLRTGMGFSSTVLKIIYHLADGKFHSGEKIASDLGMTRSAVNQAVNQISLFGLTVFSVKGKGYRLSQALNLYQPSELNSDTFSVITDINEQSFVTSPVVNTTLSPIPSSSKVSKIVLKEMIDSTNQYLLDHVEYFNNGDICIAEYQYAARGRRGRKYYAPFGCNLYFSFYWCLPTETPHISLISLLVGVVTLDALRQLGIEDLKLKWPNDIYLNNKKLGGILIETKIKQGQVHLVIGIGLNLSMNEIDPHIVTQDWISLIQADYDIDKNKLVPILTQGLITQLSMFQQTGSLSFIDTFRKYDQFAIDSAVKLIDGDKVTYGLYRGIDDFGHLLLLQTTTDLANEVTELMKVASGDISLRLQTIQDQI